MKFGITFVLVFILVFVAFVIVLALSTMFYKPKKLVEATYHDIGNSHAQISATFDKGEKEEYEYAHGMWYKLPLMEAAWWKRDRELRMIERYCKKYGNPYPTAHLNETNGTDS